MLDQHKEKLAELMSGLQENEMLIMPFSKVEMIKDEELGSKIKDADVSFRDLQGTGHPLENYKLHELIAMQYGGNLGEMAKAQILDAIPDALTPDHLRPYHSLKKSNAVPSESNVTLEQLVDRFFENQRHQNRDPETKRNYDPVVVILYDVLGKNAPVRSISRDAIRLVQDVILHMPPNVHRKAEFKGLSPIKIAEKVKKLLAAGEEVERLSSATRNKYLRAVGTIFTFATDETMIDVNPALNLTVHLQADQDEDDREPFNADDLHALFPRGYALEGLNWIPLVMLYAGLRPSEVAQLDLADIVEVDGVWCISVSKETKGKTGPERWGDKSVKNDKASVRTLPIHQKLIDLGFLKYVATRDGQTKLFEVKRYGTAGYFSSIRHEFSAWMDAVKVRSDIKVPHSFRHTWRTKAFEAMERQDFAKIIGGWSLGSGADVQTYLHTNRINMGMMKAELDKIHFDILSVDPAPDRKHDGLIVTERKRRGERTPGRKVRPKKRRLQPGKLR